ncbi:SGNH/GDSL hydrolase family protein [Faecalibaculum rodentium]|uniref:SGNH/GDSL hydrolase family protein n=1 Tax=Faecalibaculum rodentium TaxID=1702221 RepID=UPI0025B75A69|nr:GDSL-type esterase/lipase family protein [Faecalibaculum rodentium]
MKEWWNRLVLRQKFAAVGTGALFVLLLVWLAIHTQSQQVTDGRAWIREQAAKNPAELTSVLAQKRTAELKQAYSEGKISYSALLPDYAMIGDSRAAALAEYQILDGDRDIAVIGTDCQDIPNQLERITALQPANLIVSYGINDVQHNLGGSPEGFAQVYESYIQQAAKAAPGARVFVTSILDVSPAVIEEYPQYGNLGQYNEQLKAMCERNHWVFIDSGSLNAEIQDNLESDGIHLAPDMCLKWAENIVDAVGEAV